MTIFKSLYFPFLAPTKMSLTFPLAEKEKIKVTQINTFYFSRIKNTHEGKNNFGKAYTWPFTTKLDWKRNTRVMFPPTLHVKSHSSHSMPQKGDRQHYKHLQNSPAYSHTVSFSTL